MSATATGVLLGLAAAVAFEVSYVLLAAQARQAEPAGRPDARFLILLARRPWWLAAMALNGVAFALEVLALRRVSLVVVQPLLGVGLIGLVVASRFVLHEPVGPRQIAGVLLVAAGATLVVIGAPRGPARFTADAATALVVAALAIVLAFPQLRRGGGPWPLVAAAAAGDTLVALATNTVAVESTEHLVAAVLAVVAVALCGLTSITSESAALQRLPASRVGPIVSGAQTTLPALLAALLGGHHWSSAPGGGLPLAMGVVLVGAGAVCLGSRRTTRA